MGYEPKIPKLGRINRVEIRSISKHPMHWMNSERYARTATLTSFHAVALSIRATSCRRSNGIGVCADEQLAEQQPSHSLVSRKSANRLSAFVAAWRHCSDGDSAVAPMARRLCATLRIASP